VTFALELAPQLRVVVDLAVLDDDARTVLARDRLVAAGEVDDRETSRCERDRAVRVLAAAIRAAVRERRAHRRQPVEVGRSGSRRRFHRSRTCEPSLWTAGAGLPHRALERAQGRLAMHAAPDEARLPTREASLVDELEVEECVDVALAGGEPGSPVRAAAPVAAGVSGRPFSDPL